MNGKNPVILDYLLHEQAWHWCDSHEVNGTGPLQDFSYRKACISQLLCSTVISLNFGGIQSSLRLPCQFYLKHFFWREQNQNPFWNC